jgi:restriction endonuclease S subunit
MPGDCLVSCVGSLGEVALVHSTDLACVLDRNIIVISSNHQYLDERYLFLLLIADAFQEQVDLWARGTAQGHIYLGQVRNAFLVVPPLTEQQAIASYLDRETTKIDALIAKIREGIEKLKEYRTALISAAVTGTIYVRELSD